MDETIHPVIGFDAKRIVRNATGLGNYGRTLVNSLIEDYPDKYDYLLYAPDEGKERLRKQIKSRNCVRFVYPEKKMNRLQKDLWRYKGIVEDLRKDNVSIYHGLSGELPKGLREAGIHGIVTIHDLIFLRFPQYYNWFDVKIYKYKFNIACNEAEHIIAISECTKRDIMKFSGINSNMISVIYQGCDDSFKQPVSEEKKRDVRLFYGLPKRYILNVGSIEERKNVLLAIKALKYIPGDVSLVIVGKHTSYTNKILDYIEDNRLNSRVLILTDVPFSDLPAIYQMGEVFVYPSRYEGFGIPIIEAIHSGLPVVACTGSCLEEAGGPDSLYVSPDDYRGLSKALTSVLEGAPEREMRIKKSRSYVTKFDDKKVSEQVIREYDKLWWNRDV